MSDSNQRLKQICYNNQKEVCYNSENSLAHSEDLEGYDSFVDNNLSWRIRVLNYNPKFIDSVVEVTRKSQHVYNKKILLASAPIMN